MAMNLPQHELPPAVRNTLDAVRRRIRAYVWGEGLAIFVVVLGVLFWIGFLIDRTFEPSPVVRQMGLLACGLVLLYVAWRYILRRIAVPISDNTAAALLERRFPALGEHVITAVDMASRPDETAEFNPALIDETRQLAVQSIANVRPEELFDRRPLLRAVGTAFVIALSIGIFAMLSRDTFGFWLERIALSEEPWPRRVHLEVVGFPTDENGRRVTKVAQDDDFELLVHASTTGYEVPDEVEIRFRLADGRRGRDTLIRVGEATAANQTHQVFRYQFERVANDMEFDIVGGDDRVRDLQLRVVERPELFALELECEFPGYLSREPRRLPITGGMRIPEGSRLVLHAVSTKPLIGATIHKASGESPSDETLDFATQPQEKLQWEYGAIANDDVLMVSVTDIDGVTSRDPYRISMAVVRDEVPQVAVRLAGISTAVTPDATIPFVGKVTDDYGLDRAWFEFQLDGVEAVSQPLGQQPNGEPLLESLGQFDMRTTDESSGERIVSLKPGQKLAISLKAADRFNLVEGPHAGSSQQFVLDVVTAADLLALLERRELALRQHYEAIFEKMTDTRNLLGRIEFESEAVDSAADDDAEAETASESPVAAPNRDLARRRLRIAGSQQNVLQSADEVAGVAEAFDDLGLELTNNRIDNPDLKSRLREQIALPLHRIAGERLPALTAQLKLVEQNITDPAAGAAELVRTVALADEILIEMRAVLDRMLELETYNEVVSLLRDIIRDQDEINRQTKERQKERLRSLFEDE